MKTLVLPALAFLLLAASSVGLRAGVRYQAERQLEAQTQLTSEQVAIRVEEAIASRIAVAEALRGLILEGGALDDAAFVRHVSAAQRLFPGLIAVNWVDPEGVIRRVVPEGPNHPALGRNLLEHPVVGELVRSSQADRRDRFSPPLDLFQGGRGFTGYMPVVREGRLEGFLNPVFRITPLLERTLRRGGLDEAYAIEVRAEKPVFELALKGASSVIRAEEPIQVGDREWSVVLRPGPDLVAANRTPLADLMAVLGVIAAALLAGFLSAHLRRLEARRRFMAELEQRQRLQTIGTLAGGVAHEFNNHLTAIKSFAQVALRKLPPGAEVSRESIEEALTVVERSRQVVEQILTFARKRPFETKEFDLGRVVDEVSRLIQATLPAGVRLEVEVPNDPVRVQGDTGRLHQVLTNLVTNAVQALPEEGGRVRLELRADLARAEVVVQDDGPGMPPEVQARAFEPFFTTKQGGTGLGLAVTHGIVLAHEGEIEIESTPGEGTTVLVRLPRQVDETPVLA